MQGTINNKSKLSSWREKAKKRSKEISTLKKRLQELINSRGNWKEKYKEQKSVNKKLQTKVAHLEKWEEKAIGEEEKPKHHSYSLQIILLCIWMRQQGNCSLRSCASTLKIMAIVLGLNLRFPSRTTIQNWEKKLGYSRIQRRGNAEDRWVIILDESISIGQQKLLLILGVELTKYSFGKALYFEDMTVLYLGIGTSWTGDLISKQIDHLQNKGFNIEYAVSDGGTNLIKSLKTSKIPLVEDCTHAIGNLIKKRYNKEEEFLKFSKECGVFKRQVMLSKDALIMPPTQRAKGRFLNLQPLTDWAYKMLLLLEQKNSKLSKEQKVKLRWLEKYRTLVLNMNEQCKTMNQVFKVLKNEGLNQASFNACEEILKQSKSTFLKEGISQYLIRNLNILPANETKICCSDIIESFFGKYKNQLKKTGNKLITDACLSIANFNQNFDKKEIKKAMEEVKIIDLKNWRQKNLPRSLLQEKRELLKSVG